MRAYPIKTVRRLMRERVVGVCVRVCYPHKEVQKSDGKNWVTSSKLQEQIESSLNRVTRLSPPFLQ